MQSLKNIAVRLLDNWISPYVEGLEAKDFSLPLFGGSLQFHNLHLKKTLLDRFGLPVDIVAGDIGNLSVSIPWTALKTQPVKIIIDDVYVLARARPQGDVDQEADAKKEQAAKQDKLKSAEALDEAANDVGATAGSDEGNQSYIGQLMSKIVDNVQIYVTNIHIRYEDGTSRPEHPFAVGLTIAEFRAVSTDENWLEAMIQDSLRGVHKLVKLEALSVYFDTDCGSLDKGAEDRTGTINAIKQMLASPPPHQHILRPVTGEARVILNKSMSSSTPKIDAQVMFDEIGVVVDRDQYRNTLSVVDVFQFYHRTHQYHKYRPSEAEYEANVHRARLMFALRAIAAEVHDRHRRWTWEYLAERRDMRKKYVDIYVRKLASTEKTLLVQDEDALKELENALSYEDIRFFRSVARAQAKKDAATRRKLDAEKKASQAPRQTWGQWIWGTGPSEGEGGGMTEAERKELDDIIDFDAEAAAQPIGQIPNDFMRARVSAKLNKGSFSLRVDPHGETRDIIALVFDSLSADAVQLTDSVAGRFALGGFSVHDGTMTNSLYPQIVKVKDQDKKGHGPSRQASLEVGGTAGALTALSEEMDGQADAENNPFFVMEVEHKPLDGRADNALSVRMRHLEIVYHKGYVEAIRAFLTPPESQLESIKTLVDEAGDTIKGFQAQTRASLESALDNHKTIDIKVDMNAPIIIIPMDVTTKNSQALVLDAGHIAVDSKLADQDQLKEVQRKRGRQYDKEDFKQLETLMYDRFTLQLEAAQLLMGPSVDACMSVIEDHDATSESDLHVLEKINLSFSVQRAITDAPNLTKMRITGDLPELQVNFSDKKYKSLMKFIDVAVPHFEVIESEEKKSRSDANGQHPSSFRPRQIEEYVLDDTRSIRTTEDQEDAQEDAGSDKGVDQFYEARDDMVEGQRAAMHQIQFEFAFSVGRLQASLFRSTSPTAEEALANATLEGFGLTFAQRQYDMSVDLFLRNVTLAMASQNGVAKRPLLSSAAESTTTSSSDLKLVKVKYMKVQKDSPEFMNVHEGVDQAIDTELSTFNITLAPEPILRLYDFIMTTFVGKEEEDVENTKVKEVVAKEEDQAQAAQVSSDKIRVRVKLTSAQVSLENNDVLFALLALPSADVSIMLRAGTLRIGAKLGSLSLEDLTQSTVADPSFKKLLAIEGGDLAEFSYETYDPTDSTFPGYNSSVKLKAGSFKFTFMERPIRDLMSWATRFAKMKAVYDAASQAAVQRASEVTRMCFDIVVKTPIIVLPRDGLISSDRLVLRLGEIVAKNEYLHDANDTATIEAGLTGINVTSEIMVNDKKSSLQMVNDVAITARIKQAGGKEHRRDPERADTEITTEMSDVKMNLTAQQYVLLVQVLQALPQALSAAEDDENEDEESATVTPATESVPPTPARQQSTDHLVNLEPELTVVTSGDSKEEAPWNAMDLVFDVGSIALEVYDEDAIEEQDLKKHSIAQFALVKSHVGLKKLSDGAIEAEFSLNTLAFSNTRTGKSVHRDIIPHTTQNGNQIMVQYTASGGSDNSSLAIVTIDSPRFILAFDPLSALLAFAQAPFTAKADHDQGAQPQLDDEPVDQGVTKQADTKPGQLAFRVNIVNAKISVLANDSDKKSQVIELTVTEILLSQQSIMAFKIDKLGMSFGTMDTDARVTFLDDLNVAMSLDTRQRGSQQMSSFEVEVPDPVIFRASYTDIMLITDIVNKAIAVANQAGKQGEVQETEARKRQNTGGTDASSTKLATTTVTAPRRSLTNEASARRTSVSRRRVSVDKSKVLVSKEQLRATINGFQFVLVGDMQEIPMVHLSANEFSISVQDWSGDMKASTSLTTSIRYFNLANSYFEPLLDPWRFDIKAQRTSISPGNNPLSVRISAPERLEVNLTSAFVELAITSMTLWSKHTEKTNEERGDDAPFRLRNYTGYTLHVWPESRDLSKEPIGLKSLLDGQEFPWRFENAARARENVSALRHNSLGIQIQDGNRNSRWEKLRQISVDRAGEKVLTLRPRLDTVSHQIACEIKLENNVKIITFRSTLNVENQTSLPIEMIVVDSHGKASTGALRIDPGQSMPMPLIDAYEKRFRLRPLKGFNFDYSWSLPLHWRQLMSRPIRSISCKHQTPKEPAFFFQGQAIFDEKDPATRTYPRMTLRLRAPLEVENLLPYDIKFRIHDKHSGLSSSNWLSKGLSSPIHTVEVSHLMLISISAEDTNLNQSDYAIIGSDDPELPQEDHFHVTDQQGNKLMLKLNYHTYPDSGKAFKVQIYSPYIFINKTGLPFDLAAKTWTGGQKPIAGNDLFANDWQHDTPTPFMFGFPNEDRRNRLYLKVGDTKWSKPLSFEPVAADMQIVLGSNSGKSDTYVGLSYSEGLGKYKLTKVITIAPRFMVKNMFSYALRIRQHSTNKDIVVKKGDTVPIHELQSGAPAQLSMAFDEPNLKWSAPFNLADIGRTNFALQRQTTNHGEKTYLMRVESHIQGSSIWTYLSRETDPWPIKIRNETNLKLSYQQVDDDGAKQRYPQRQVNARSEADYAWDYPTAPNRRIQLSCDGVPLPRNIDMMAIGIQPPLKIPGGPQTANRNTGQRSSMISTDIQADGNSQLLVISHYDPETSVYKPAKRGAGAIKRSDSTDSITTASFETVAISDKPNMTITVELEGIGLSVITKSAAELFYLSLRGLKLAYSDYPTYYEANLDLKWIQIDNQLFGGLFPIILYPTVIPKDGKELESHPTLQTTVAVLKDQSHGVTYIKYATILLQSMTVELDEDFLFALLDFVKFKDAAWKEPAADVLIEHPKDIQEPDITVGQSNVFFEALHLQPIALELSFMRTDRVNVDEQLNSGGVFYYILNALTMTLGNVNAAPVNFRSLALENVRLNSASLQERVILHYQEQFVGQIYRVLGSADFLGNPVGLFTNISSGFSDIFYEPYQGMVMHGNSDIGFGLARGWTSFAKKTVFGISDSVTKVTSSIGKGLSAATLDAEYQSKRRMTQKRNKPKHALYGVAAGASAFANSMTSAFEGVASKPMDGAVNNGAAGFVKGMGQGVVGLFTKPAVGIFDFVSASTEGIRNTTTVFDQGNIERARLPRFIAADGVLRPFSAREALGQSWLKEAREGAYFHENYVAHLDIKEGDDTIAILSNNRIILIQLRKLREVWSIPFDHLQSVSVEPTGIAFKNRDSSDGPFLPITNVQAKQWFFKSIGKVVTAYNNAHQRDD